MAIRPRTAVFIGAAAVIALAIGGTVVYNVSRQASSATSSAVTWWVPDWDYDGAVTLAKQFEKDNPGLTVTLVKTTGDTIANKVSVALDSGNVPDVITESIARTKTYIGKGQLADLSSVYGTDMPKSDFAPGLVNVVSAKNATYAVPYRWATNALIYNPTLFKAAGITSPPTTWGEFAKDAALLTSGNVAGTAWPMKGDPSDLTLRFLDFALADGSTIKNGTPSLTNGSVAASLDLIGGSIVKGWATKSSFELDNTGIRELFLQGRVAMYLGGVFDVDTAKAQSAPVASALMPGPRGAGTAQGVGWSYIVPKASTHQDAAKKLVAFLGTPQNMAKLTLTFPARVSASNDAKFQTPERKPFAKQLADHSIPAPNDPKWTSMIQFVHDQIESVGLGQTTSQAAGQAIMKQASTTLGQ
jgi:ABC-type glycerol-3-phosphate transport system substrate-binding protein